MQHLPCCHLWIWVVKLCHHSTFHLGEHHQATMLVEEWNMVVSVTIVLTTGIGTLFLRTSLLYSLGSAENNWNWTGSAFSTGNSKCSVVSVVWLTLSSYYVIWCACTSKLELDQLKDGLKTLKLLSTMETHASKATDQVLLTADALLALFKVVTRRVKWSWSRGSIWENYIEVMCC